MYSEILSFKDVLLGLAQDCVNGGQDVGVVLDGIEDYCVSMAFKHGMKQDIPKKYNDWFSDSGDVISESKVVIDYIDEIVDNSFFGFTDYSYISKMLEAIHNTFELNKGAKSYLLNDNVCEFVFDFLPRFKSYIESPLENKDFETDVYELIKEEPSSIIKSIYFMGTEFIVEKEILKKLGSAQEKEIEIKLPTFYVEIGQYIRSEMSKGNFSEGAHKSIDVLSRMKHFGLIDYDGGVGNISNLNMTELGVSAYETIKTQKVSVSCKIPIVKKPSNQKQSEKQKVGAGQVKNDSSFSRLIKASVPVEKKESVKYTVDSELVKKMLGGNMSSTKKRKVRGDLFSKDERDVRIDDDLNLEPVVDEIVADKKVWSNVYEGRRFPYGISVGDDDSLRIALDVDKKNVFDILSEEGLISNEFLCLLSTLMYEGQKDEIATILRSNGDLDGMFLSLEEKGLVSIDAGASVVSYSGLTDNIIDAMNLGFSALIAYNPKLDDREKGIFEFFSESTVSNEIKIL